MIVARSYVRQLAAGSDPANPASEFTSRRLLPARSCWTRHGHRFCAAANSVTGAVAFSGMAPKAYLGNYKIYGSPGLNDSSSEDVIIQALEDAYNDGMDVINFSTGGPALTGALDTGSICGNKTGVPCDLTAKAFEDMARKGLVIVASAGNLGDNALLHPAFNSDLVPR